jgi:RNA polymerase sigma-70 factor (ECF subfamily)
MTGLVSSASSTTATSWVVSAVQRAVAGDEVAFAQIVATYHRDLVRVAYVITGDVPLAEDAAQSAWSIAWRRLSSLREPERLRPWLVSVAANEARQLIRSRHRRMVTEIRARADDDPADDPSAEIDRIDLLNALHHLTVDDRRLLALRYVAGLEPTEISTLVGRSPSGVRGHFSRILGRLRKELRDG